MADDNSNLETTNINLKWLNNIYEQLMRIEEMERLSKEGCSSIADYLLIPPDQRGTLLPDLQYKNLKLLVLEMDILVDNLAPVIVDKASIYKQRIERVLNVVENQTLFLKPIYSSEKKLNYFQVLDLLPKTVGYLSLIIADLIKDIGSLLFIASEGTGKKKW